jgi:lipopolysaccharide biosynthesis glycosyltransferase
MGEAYATLLYGSRADAAMETMLYSLRAVDTGRTIVVMTLDEVATIPRLKRRFAPLEEAPVSRLRGACNASAFARARRISEDAALSVFSRFHTFNLTRYARVLWLESDQLVLRSLESLWRLPFPARAAAAATSVLTERCAAEYAGGGAGFRFAQARKYNTGVVLLRPSVARFTALTAAMTQTTYTCTDGSQTLWNRVLARHTVCIHHTYNCIKHSGPRYPWLCLPENQSTPHVVHFAGAGKPWLSSSPRDATVGTRAWRTMVARAPL